MRITQKLHELYIKSIIVIFVLSLIAGAFSTVAIGYWFTIGDCYVWLWPKEEFQAERWEETPSSQRYIFAKAMLESEEFVGMSRDDLVELLGPPDGESHYAISYTIRTFDSGQCFSGFGANLDFFLDHDGTVTAAEMRVWGD